MKLVSFEGGFGRIEDRLVPSIGVIDSGRSIVIPPAKPVVAGGAP